jgi:GT2 family glycosyltransferase
MVAMSVRDVGVLITCHNRRELTLRCLRSLFEQRGSEAAFSVFLVDDGSTDGTSEAVAEEFPAVTIISGNGQLYWSGGMRLAFDAATHRELHFHLWLNDDVVLADNAVDRLLSTYDEMRRANASPIIVVGAMQDPTTGTTTYSGWRRGPFWWPFRFEQMEPGPLPRLCDTMNGNVVLVSREAFEKIGGIDRAFVHSIGDFDYGLRLSRMHGQVWLAPDYVGTCRRDEAPGADGAVGNSIDRLRNIASIKILPPGPWLAFVRHHGGPLWPIFWVGPYARAVLAPLWQKLARVGMRAR